MATEVRRPKTEHHAGHEQRIVPITSTLMTLPQDRFAAAEEGQQRLVTIRGKGAVLRQVRAIWHRTSVKQCNRLWQILRQSCEKQRAMNFPQYAVSKWIGHSITISGKHYANHVPDELFDKAAGPGRGAESGAETARNHPKRPETEKGHGAEPWPQFEWFRELAGIFRKS